MTKKLQSTTNKLAPILALAVILGIWYACAGFEVVPAYMLPSPTDVWLAFVHNFSVMMSQAKVTLQEALYGLGIGVALAFILSALMDRFHFGSSTGYGYGDEGRETLDKVWAQVFGAEDALVRHNFTCGTHTLAVALFGVLRPGDKMLCVSGMPYDTLHSVIGLTGENMGSLKDYGIAFDCVPLKEEHLDYEAIAKAVDDTVTMVYIQRSRGYELRASLSLEETQKVAEIAKEKNPNCIVMVDNCYCEFVNKQEPTKVGADLIAGSLIKNAGGGMARTGGYIAGRHTGNES